METKRRGLGSLIPGIDGGWPVAPVAIQEAPLDEIAPNPYQPRRQYDAEKLAELADSMREHGVVQPLVVRTCGAGYELIAGERRLQAARRAGLDRVPVVVRECTDQEMLELALIENLQREDINCVEAGRAYRRLVDEFRLTQEEVAARLGKSRSAIANTMRLLGLPETVQDSLLAGRITEGHGRALLAIEDEQAIITACRRIERGGLSVRQAEGLARRARPAEASCAVSRETPATEQKMGPNIRFLQDRLRDALLTKVTLKPRGESGTIEIEYYSAEDLDRISSYILRDEQGDVSSRDIGCA